MITLIQHELDTNAGLAERFRTEDTEKLQDLYRLVREMDHGDVLDPWAEIANVVARELRVRIAADWLHGNWCVPMICVNSEKHLAGHQSASRSIVEAFEAGGCIAEVVYRGMYPVGPISAADTAALSQHRVFQGLISALVSVVPAEAEVTA